MAKAFKFEDDCPELSYIEKITNGKGIEPSAKIEMIKVYLEGYKMAMKNSVKEAE